MGDSLSHLDNLLAETLKLGDVQCQRSWITSGRTGVRPRKPQRTGSYGERCLKSYASRGAQRTKSSSAPRSKPLLI